MNITILTFGTRGDVEPPLALAHGLTLAGHRVRLVAPVAYHEWVASYGVEPARLRFDMGEMLRRSERERGGRARRLGDIRAMRAEVMAGSAESLEDYRAASNDADFVVQWGAAQGGVEIADQRDIAMACAYPYPYAPTKAFPSYFVPWRGSLGGNYNWWTQQLALAVSWRTYGRPLNQWRSEQFHLPPWTSYARVMESGRRRGPALYAYSPSVLPKPSDWSDDDHVTGYWFLPPQANWTLPPELARFLEDGPPPVFVGFGSMPSAHAEEMTATVLLGLEKAGCRGVLLAAGGGALARRPSSRDVLFVDVVPYRWLFPRMAAVVHHGGAGTTAAVLNAGVPGIVMPLELDQFAWARRVEELGVSVRGAHLRKLSADNLAAAIRKAVAPQIAERARRMGETIRAETGVANAVALIERAAGRFDRKAEPGADEGTRTPTPFGTGT